MAILCVVLHILGSNKWNLCSFEIKFVQLKCGVRVDKSMSFSSKRGEALCSFENSFRKTLPAMLRPIVVENLETSCWAQCIVIA